MSLSVSLSLHRLRDRSTPTHYGLFEKEEKKTSENLPRKSNFARLVYFMYIYRS
jgi:hypothetical protein